MGFNIITSFVIYTNIFKMIKWFQVRAKLILNDWLCQMFQRKKHLWIQSSQKSWYLIYFYSSCLRIQTCISKFPGQSQTMKVFWDDSPLKISPGNLDLFWDGFKEVVMNFWASLSVEFPLIIITRIPLYWLAALMVWLRIWFF